jgi:Ca-activated chloride channel family protein
MKGFSLLSFFAAPTLFFAGLAAAALAALLVAAAARAAARRRDAIVSAALSARTSAAPSRAHTIALRLLVFVVALALGAALARPRWGERTETVERRGADVVLVLDTSASMRATDLTPSRFVVARQAALSLLSNLPADRTALVGCEGEAQTLVPLTMDAAAVGIFLEALEPGIGARPGTSLASGLASAAELFPPGAEGGKNCVVFSDGEDLEGGVEKAAERAKAGGIVVHTVFVGGDGKGAPVPETDVSGQVTGYKTDASGAPVISKPDPGLLRDLAAQTGGTFSVVAPGRTDLSAVAARIDLSARRPLSATLATNLEERFQIPLGIAVAALGVLLVGLPRARRGAMAGALALAAIALCDTARAQEPPAPMPSPTPLPRLERLLGSPRGEAKLGRKAMEEKRWDDAAAHFRRETELSPKNPIGPYNLGSALSRAGKTREALVALETPRKSLGGAVAADASYNAGETLFRAGDYEKAAGAFREALKRQPGVPDASFNYELCARKVEEEKKKQREQNQQQKQNPRGSAPTPTPSPQGSKGDEQRKQRDREFESKAKMSREKAEQLLAAIQRADLSEQRRKIAEQKQKRRVGRDW